jgi:hypothetical protein
MAAWLVVQADGPSSSVPPTPDKPAAADDRSASDHTRSSLPPGTQEVDSPSRILSTTEQAAVNEILQIRREQGGLLDGTLLEELSGLGAQAPGSSTDGQEAEFARALRGVAAAASTESNPERVVAPGSTRASASSSLGGGDDSRISTPTDTQLIEQLRLTARWLDSRGADFEEADDYRQADRCRATANQLRRLARDLKGPPLR